MADNKTTTRPARRRFFTMLAGAVAAPAAAAALPATAATTSPVEPVIAESPELLALGERLAAKIAELKLATAAKDEARTIYGQTKPAVPDELTTRAGGDRHLTDNDFDLEGNITDVMVYRSRLIRSHLALYEINGRTKEGRRYHRLARLARKYEKADAAALKASGYDDRRDEERRAAEDVIALARALAKLEPATAMGAAIFARLMMVYDEASRAAGYLSSDTLTGKLSRRLAGATLRIAGRA